MRVAALALIIGICWWAAQGVSIDVERIGRGLPAIVRIGAAMVPDRQWLLPALAALRRQLSNAIRTFPELVLGVFFVASYGPGATAGTLALGVHSIGMLGRMYADVMENVDPGPVEALVAAGASKLQVFRFAVLPQVLFEFVATAVDYGSAWLRRRLV